MRYAFFIFFMLCSSTVVAQGIALNTSGSAPDSSAILDVSSVTQGFLAPRMSGIQRDAILNPADGLIIFNTTSGCPNYYFNGSWFEWCGTQILPVGSISTLDCIGAANFGVLTDGTPASGVYSELSYTGGNGGTHSGQTVNSSGVTGLSAALIAGTFANGTGILTYTINGTPSGSGTATFALSIGGQSCTLSLTVNPSVSNYPPGTVHCSGIPTPVIDVLNPSTGKTWMDRNLGASQVALSSNDANSYGDLYQWGRRSDGHQCRSSSTSTELSSTDTPNHGNFILVPNSPNDWRNPQNSNLWQGVNGVNNPCPIGYRLPTSAELNAERASWSPSYAAGAIASPLKLPMAGSREGSSGSLGGVGTVGRYWSSNASSTFSSALYFNNSSDLVNSEFRARGFAVRCIKE